MCQAQEAQLSTSTTQTGKDHSRHLCTYSPSIGVCGSEGDKKHAAHGQRNEDHDPNRVRYDVDKVRCTELRKKRRYNIREKHDALWDVWTDQVQCSGENDYVENVVNETCKAEKLATRLMLLQEGLGHDLTGVE